LALFQERKVKRCSNSSLTARHPTRSLPGFPFPTKVATQPFKMPNIGTPFFNKFLEYVFQSKLDLAHARVRGADRSEAGRRQTCIRKAKVRMIGRVEELETKLKLLLFPHAKTLENRGIHVDDTGSDQCIAPNIA